MHFSSLQTFFYRNVLKDNILPQLANYKIEITLISTSKIFNNPRNFAIPGTKNGNETDKDLVYFTTARCMYFATLW